MSAAAVIKQNKVVAGNITLALLSLSPRGPDHNFTADGCSMRLHVNNYNTGDDDFSKLISFKGLIRKRYRRPLFEA
jgi:hypothetical protein